MLQVNYSSFADVTSLHFNKRVMNNLNHLKDETSPYLLMHAKNPVDWYPWGEEALNKARKENKLIIISIGYAACHWCHVMEHESFAHQQVADIMNANFVSIKVDREERPDVDQVYMDVVQIISGRGGWPLNAIALPDGRPVYAATYFHRENWIQVLNYFVQLFKNEPQKLIDQAHALMEGLNSIEAETDKTSKKVDLAVFQKMTFNWISKIDQEYGGMSGAPKFPMPVGYNFLLHFSHMNDNPEVDNAIITSLNGMFCGGIYDHIGGGFARYSTDSYWKVPHFEKMLYDNAQLIGLYADAYKKYGQVQFKITVEESIQFLQNELSAPNGAFYSSLDADSEGEEGKFYVWTHNEFKQIAEDEQPGNTLLNLFNIMREGNWEHGKNIPYIVPTDIQQYKNMYSQLKNLKEKFLTYRNSRIRPALDDKILTSWNALAISGLVKAYQALQQAEYLQMAIKTAHYILDNHTLESGKVCRTSKHGKRSINGFLDDYAFIIEALIHLYQATFDLFWIEKAKKILQFTIENFSGKNSALFYYTSAEDAQLITRKKETSDNVIPSSNSVMASNLFIIGTLSDEQKMINRAEKMVQCMVDYFEHSGPYFANWANLALKMFSTQKEIAIIGQNAIEYRKKLGKFYLPEIIFCGSEKEENLPLLNGKHRKGETLIYLCENKTCQHPENDIDRFIAKYF